MTRFSSCRNGQSAPTPSLRSLLRKRLSVVMVTFLVKPTAHWAEPHELVERLAVFGTPDAAPQHEDQRIATLQERQLAFYSGMVGQLVIGEGCSLDYVGLHLLLLLSLPLSEREPRRAQPTGAAASPGITVVPISHGAQTPTSTARRCSGWSGPPRARPG